MFKRTAGVSCSLKESIDGLEIIVCGKMFHCTMVCGKNDHLYVSFCVVSNPTLRHRHLWTVLSVLLQTETSSNEDKIVRSNC